MIFNLAFESQGQHGHREAVLSLSWHPTGSQFASSGMDKVGLLNCSYLLSIVAS